MSSRETLLRESTVPSVLSEGRPASLSTSEKQKEVSRLLAEVRSLTVRIEGLRGQQLLLESQRESLEREYRFLIAPDLRDKPMAAPAAPRPEPVVRCFACGTRRGIDYSFGGQPTCGKCQKELEIEQWLDGQEN